jgi:hypothetical protein
VSKRIDEIEPEAGAAIQVRFRHRDRAGAAAVANRQPQDAVADRGADANDVVGVQAGVLDAVGHQLRHHELDVGEQPAVDLSGQRLPDG